jgi:hypothetical protein
MTENDKSSGTITARLSRCYVLCKNGELKFVTADTAAQLVWE